MLFPRQIREYVRRVPGTHITASGHISSGNRFPAYSFLCPAPANQYQPVRAVFLAPWKAALANARLAPNHSFQRTAATLRVSSNRRGAAAAKLNR
jgi:hypothetical protein